MDTYHLAEPFQFEYNQLCILRKIEMFYFPKKDASVEPFCDKFKKEGCCNTLPG